MTNKTNTEQKKRKALEKMSHKCLVNLYQQQRHFLNRSRQFALKLYQENIILARLAKYELSNRLFGNDKSHLTNEQYHKLGTQFNIMFDALKQNYIDSGKPMLFDAFFEQEYVDYLNTEVEDGFNNS